MTLVSLGDMAHAFMLRRQNTAMKADIQRLATEVTTGLTTDVGKTVRGDVSPLAAIQTSLTRIDAYRAVTAEVGLTAGAMQTALATVEDLATGLAPSLLSGTNSGETALIGGVAADARQRFETAVSALNARLGDRTLFAGDRPDGPALAGADTILTALESEIAGLTTAADIATAIAAWFDAPTGFAATAYLGGAPTAPVPIAPGDSAELTLTAADPVLRDTLRGLAMAALLDRSVLPAAPAERADLARIAGETLMESQTGRALLAARVGTIEARIEAAATRNAAEASGLEIARAGLLSVDPYETATALERTQTQLETLYAITARLSRLSLVDFLR